MVDYQLVHWLTILEIDMLIRYVSCIIYVVEWRAMLYYKKLLSRTADTNANKEELSSKNTTVILHPVPWLE